MTTNPRDPALLEVHRLMVEAAGAYQRGDFAGALFRCRQVLQLRPGMPEALHLLGLCLWRQGDPAGAAGNLTQAARYLPDDAQLFHNLGILRTELGDLMGARAAFECAAGLDPGFSETRFNLAVVSEELGDFEGAEQAYRRVLDQNPTHAAATAALASLCEQRNDLEEAQRWVARAMELDPADPVANLVQAQMDFRAGRHQESADRLRSQLARPMTPRNRALTAGRLGAVYDRMDQTDQAWSLFLEAKAALREMADPRDLPGPYGLDKAEQVNRHLEALLQDAVPASGEGEAQPSPVFLVGFPRSGTTLLDQILSSHPAVSVLEEKDTLLDFVSDFTRDDASMKALSMRSPASLEDYRQAYWRRLALYMPERDPGKRLIDKMPLNTLFLPMIQRLFPGSRFIFAVRDPRDVVLSCFMQTFVLNQAMRHFLELEESARYYAAVMDIGRRSIPRLGPRLHMIRYEALVEDTAGEARRLIEFLGLAWDPSVLDFDRTARQRRINTPSYHQVAQPIYTRSRGRWMRYAKRLEPIAGILSPYVEYFGYT